MTDSNRELVAPRGNKRFVRRDSKGRFARSDEVSRSISKDVRHEDLHESKHGQGERGDRTRH